jgi:hypothetical protein
MAWRGNSTGTDSVDSLVSSFGRGSWEAGKVRLAFRWRQKAGNKGTAGSFSAVSRGRCEAALALRKSGDNGGIVLLVKI